MEEELDNQYYDKSERSIPTCLSLCNKRNISCIRTAGNAALGALVACGITGTVIIPAVAPISMGGLWGFSCCGLLDSQKSLLD